jgi:hypothetical protein
MKLNIEKPGKICYYKIRERENGRKAAGYRKVTRIKSLLTNSIIFGIIIPMNYK